MLTRDSLSLPPSAESDDLPLLPASAPPLRRSLSLEYIFNGERTMADPNSFTGEERRLRQDAVLSQLSYSGYADGIRQERGLTLPESKVSETIMPEAQTIDQVDQASSHTVPRQLWSPGHCYPTCLFDKKSNNHDDEGASPAQTIGKHNPFS